VAYRIELTSRAARQFAELEAPLQKRIGARIDALAKDPRPPSSRKLVGSDDLYRIRVGDYRVIYRIEDRVVLITVIRIGHRRDVYR
jgi:mRNA interferase RelE/StbE